MFIQDKDLNLREIEDDQILNKIKGNFTIALDFDGIFTNPYELKIKYLQKLGYDLKGGQCGREFCLKLGMNEEDYERESIKAYTESVENLPLQNNFLQNFLKLRNLPRISIFILTSRYDYMIKHLQEYLKYHQIRVDGIINTNNQRKDIALKKIGARIFVEDTLSKIIQIIEEDIFHEECSFILYRNLQNKFDQNDCKKIIEIYNWEDLSKIILKKYREFMHKTDVIF